MKKLISKILAVLLITVITTGCKKNAEPKDYSQSIKDKTWWGTLNYTGQSDQFYSVQFNADNSLLWNQMSGETPGHWVLDGKTLKITFSGNSVEIKAGISDDNKLINISDNTGNSEIKSGELIVNSGVPLDNSNWIGTGAGGVQIAFEPAYKFKLFIGASPYGPYIYTRSASGAVIRSVSAGIFAIVISNTEMRGSFTSATNALNFVKQ